MRKLNSLVFFQVLVCLKKEIFFSFMVVFEIVVVGLLRLAEGRGLLKQFAAIS